MRTRGANGQTTAEYAILIGVAIAALLGMQVYTRRGLNARWKDASDSASHVVTEQLKFTTSSGPDTDYQQYEPYYASSTYRVEQTADANVHEATGGVMTRDNIIEDTNRTGTQDVAVPQ